MRRLMRVQMRPHFVERRATAPWKRGVLVAAVAAFSVWLAGSAMAQSADPGRYRGSLRWFIADLKTSFPEHKQYSQRSALTESNYAAVLAGLKNNVGVNGIRLPIFPGERDSSHYPRLYTDVVAYARSIGLAIYASPMSVGMGDFAGWSDDEYAAWLADYANRFRPEFLSPFNEPGISDERMIEIVSRLRTLLTTHVLLLGPDRQHVDRTVDDLARNASVGQIFDIVDSHNANRDGSATRSNWGELVRLEPKPVWSSENPANWSAGADPSLPGVADAVDAGVRGLVIWSAKPSLVDDRGEPTQKAKEIADHLAN